MGSKSFRKEVDPSTSFLLAGDLLTSVLKWARKVSQEEEVQSHPSPWPPSPSWRHPRTAAAREDAPICSPAALAGEHTRAQRLACSGTLHRRLGATPLLSSRAWSLRPRVQEWPGPPGGARMRATSSMKSTRRLGATGPDEGSSPSVPFSPVSSALSPASNASPRSRALQWACRIHFRASCTRASRNSALPKRTGSFPPLLVSQVPPS